ncbi:MAG: hypothetical protein Q9M23_05100 [Mariprofundaceae bacterium]|nr:hypothetical protein [Mariprofundaceae bacterium]
MKAETIMIPAAFRHTLSERNSWQDMLKLMEGLEAGSTGLSEGHVQTDWEVFVMRLPEDQAVAAEMLVSAAACICSYRPEFLDTFLEDILTPLIALDVRYPNELMDWYAARETIAPEVQQWIKQELPPRFNWVGESVDGNRDLLEFVGLPDVKNIAAVAPKQLRMTNYSEVWGSGLFLLLLALPFATFSVIALIPTPEISLTAFVICMFVLGLIITLASKVMGGKTVSVDFADELVVHRFMAPDQHYTPQDIRHIGLRNVRAKLYFIYTLSSHEFAEIVFFDGEEASVRVTGRELAHLMLFLAARGLSSRMGVSISSNGIVPIIPVWFGLTED